MATADQKNTMEMASDLAKAYMANNPGDVVFALQAYTRFFAMLTDVANTYFSTEEDRYEKLIEKYNVRSA